MNLLALAFLIVAFVLLVAFHFMPLDDSTPGWAIWPGIVEMGRELVRNPEMLEWSGGWETVILIAVFPCLALLVFAAPWLVGVLGRSRVLWWIATLLAGVSTICLWTLILKNVPAEGYHQPMVALLAIPLLNLGGLLLIRGQRREAGSVPPEGESP